MPTALCVQCERTFEGAAEGTVCPDDGAYLVDPAVRARHSRDTLLGRLIGDEFAVVDVLGIGGFGTVYRALQIPVMRPVAVKVLHGQFLRSESVRARFFQEARALGMLSGSSVVELIRYGEQAPGTPLPGSPGCLYIAQEFVTGRTLKAIIEQEAPLDPARTVRIATGILEALAEAHGRGVVHRDLKPANVMVSRTALGDERVKVLDFGIAKLLSDPDDSSPQTATDASLGTPAYMAPELLQSKYAGTTADLYALGVILFEMLVGERPFPGTSPVVLVTAHLQQPVPPLPGETARDRALEGVIHRAMAKDIAARYPDAEQMLQALRAALETPALPAPPPAKSRRTHIALAAVIAALGLAAAFVLGQETPPQQPAAKALSTPPAIDAAAPDVTPDVVPIDAALDSAIDAEVDAARRSPPTRPKHRVRRGSGGPTTRSPGWPAGSTGSSPCAAAGPR